MQFVAFGVNLVLFCAFPWIVGHLVLRSFSDSHAAQGWPVARTEAVLAAKGAATVGIVWGLWDTLVGAPAWAMWGLPTVVGAITLLVLRPTMRHRWASPLAGALGGTAGAAAAVAVVVLCVPVAEDDGMGGLLVAGVWLLVGIPLGLCAVAIGMLGAHKSRRPQAGNAG